MLLKQKLEEIDRDLNKANFPTKRVAEMAEIGLSHMAELKRLIALAIKTIGQVNSDDPELVKVLSLLGRINVGVAINVDGLQHDLVAAKVVEENGLAVLVAIEGKTSMSTKISVRRDFMLKEITKAKVDAAALSRGGGGGRGGGAPRGGGRGGGNGRGGRGGRGGGGGGGAKPPMTEAAKARLKCYSCQGTGHLSAQCPNKPN
jgi:uncharacterized membrane protein YgcG